MMHPFSRSPAGFAALFLLALSCLCGAPGGARANAGHEARIKAMFTGMLERQVQNAARPGEPRKIEIDGEVTVEPVKDYYAVTLPRMRVLYPGGERIEIGMISANVTAPEAAGPLKPGQWKMTVALPSPIPGYDKDGVEIMRVSLGSQRAAGIWDEALENFIKLDARYSGVKIDFPASRGHIEVPGLSILYNLAEDGDKRFSGLVSFEFQKPAWDIPAMETKGGIGRLAFRMDLERFAAEYLKKTGGFLPEKMDFTNPDFFKAGDGVKISLKAGDAEFSTPAMPASGLRNGAFKLADGAFDFSLSDVLSGVADGSASLVFSGLKAGPDTAGGAADPGDPSALIPAQGQIRISHENIPVASLLQVMAGSAGAGQMAGLGLMLRIPALFSQAGSRLEIRQSSVGNARYRVDMDGQMAADIAAMLGVTASGKMSFAGLDEVISILRAAPGRYQSRPDIAGGLNVARAFLEDLKLRGKVRPATGKPPEPVYDYDFRLEPSGIFTINGIGALPGLPAAPSAPAAVPPAPVYP